jgi:mono/diheme cytochrome c family protein
MGSTLVLLALLSAPTQLPADPIGGGTPQNELVVPLADTQTCATCHATNNATEMPYDTYRGTMMDLAGVDPVFLASLEVAYDDAQPAAELCIRCHFPRGWLAGRGEGTPEQDFGLLTTDLQGVPRTKTASFRRPS